jgi:hypothetical protein
MRCTRQAVTLLLISRLRLLTIQLQHTRLPFQQVRLESRQLVIQPRTTLAALRGQAGLRLLVTQLLTELAEVRAEVPLLVTQPVTRLVGRIQRTDSLHLEVIIIRLLLTGCG